MWRALFLRKSENGSLSLFLSSRITTHYSQIASYAKIHSPRSRFAQSLSANRTQRSTTNKSAYLCNCRFSLLESRAVKTFPSRRFSAGAAWSICIYVWKCARNSINIDKIYQSKKYIIPRIRGTLLLQLYSDISKGDSLFLPLKRHDAITRGKNKSTSDHPVCNSQVIRHRFALFFFYPTTVIHSTNCRPWCVAHHHHHHRH